jgi:hypothetical protein
MNKAAPDYTTARQDAGFDWAVSGSQDSLRQLAGIPIRDFNLDPAACIEAYRKGRPLHREFFGPDVELPNLRTPAISYGHVNALGAELTFPEDGEVGHAHLYGSLTEGIAALKKPVDFSKAGMAPFYVEFRSRMQAAFPDERVGLSYGAQGPITTAWELRGEGFFTDLYDDPPAAREFLRLVTASMIEFRRFLCGLDAAPMVNPVAVAWPTILPAWFHPASGRNSFCPIGSSITRRRPPGNAVRMWRTCGRPNCRIWRTSGSGAMTRPFPRN